MSISLPDENPASRYVEWLDRARRQDRHAFAQLYEATYRRVFGYLLARVGEQAAAEDLLQEVYLAALRAIGRFRGRTEGEFIGWLLKIAHAKGDHVWHVHEDTDEFFLVLEGQFDIALRSADGSETTVVLRTGDTFVVPKGVEHKPTSPGGSILMFEPSGTSSTGDRHDGDIPAHVDSTAGHGL